MHRREGEVLHSGPEICDVVLGTYVADLRQSLVVAPVLETRREGSWDCPYLECHVPRVFVIGSHLCMACCN